MDSAFWSHYGRKYQEEMESKRALESLKAEQRKRLHLPPPPSFRHVKR